MDKNIKRAILKYGFNKCVKAYNLCDKQGEGARNVGVYLDLTTNQADAAINAGRYIANNFADLIA